MADFSWENAKISQNAMAFIATEPKFEGNIRNFLFCTLNGQKMPVQ